jgi:hypothetical protein
MNNVVQLRAPKPGEPTFMLCGCNPKEPEAFMPIVLVQQNPVVVGLMCPRCETHLTVVNGVIQEKNPADEVKADPKPITQEYADTNVMCKFCGRPTEPRVSIIRRCCAEGETFDRSRTDREMRDDDGG